MKPEMCNEQLYMSNCQFKHKNSNTSDNGSTRERVKIDMPIKHVM